MRVFPPEFWNVYTVALVAVTVVLLCIAFAAIGYILFVLVYCLAGSLLPVKREICVDEVFGKLQRERRGRSRGSWEGMFVFHDLSTGVQTMQLEIDAGDGQPTSAQRELFRELVSRYPTLWPEIGEELASIHPRWKTIESVTKHVDEALLSLDFSETGQPSTWSIDYTFDTRDDSEDDFCGYTVNFVDWKIVGVDVGD